MRVVGLLSGGGVGPSKVTSGLIGNARVGLDVEGIALWLSYTVFSATPPSFVDPVAVGQIKLMGGYVFSSSRDVMRFRVLGGLDVMAREPQTDVGPVLGTNVRVVDRTRFGREGIDATLTVTLWPHRQLEARAAVLHQLWIFEGQLGWYWQVVDDTTRLYTSGSRVNGPFVGVGIAL